MKKTINKGQQKMMNVLLFALIVLLLAASFVYLYKFTDLFSKDNLEKISAKPVNVEGVLEDSDNSAVETGLSLEVLNENGEIVAPTMTENGEIIAPTMTKNGETPVSNPSTSTNTQPQASEQEILDAEKITTYQFVSNQADELLQEIELKPEQKLTGLCTDSATPTSEGKIVFPIDPKYSKLFYLGQIFTAAKCGNERLVSLWGMTANMYSLGVKLKLSKEPNGELRSNLLNLGFSCDDNIEHDKCKNWTLSKPVEAKSLVILEPFVDYMDSDDCVDC